MARTGLVGRGQARQARIGTVWRDEAWLGTAGKDWQGEVKEKFGAPAAKAIISGVGGKAKMAEIVDPKAIDAVYDAAKAKLEDEGM